MNLRIIVILFLTVMWAFSCEQQNKSTEAPQTESQNPTLFAKGEKIESDDRFKGTVWVNFLVRADSVNQTSVGSVIFEQGARSDWHIHPAGQILLATGGVGYYQEKGSPKIILHKGDAVKCPPNVPHWHGAGPDEEFIQIAVTGRENGPTEWLQDVTDEEYNR